MGLVAQFLNITKNSVINAEPLNIKSEQVALLLYTFYLFSD
jgi:hypothetical protein